MADQDPGFFRKHAGRFIGSAVLTVCVIWGLRHSGLELVPAWSQFAHVRWWTLGVYVVLWAAVTWFRAVRWRFLLRKVAPDVTKTRLLAISCVGFAAILILPFRLGEFVRPGMLHEKGKVSFTAATGSIIGERVVDLLYLSTVLAVALLVVPTIQPMPEHVVGLPVTVAQVRGYAFFMVAGAAGVFTIMAAYFFARDFAKRATLAIVGLVSRPLAEKLADQADRLAHGLDFLRDGRAAAGFMFETTMYWVINAASMWVLAWGAGLVHADGSAPTFGEAFALMGMLGVTILIPGPPGMLGIFQAGLFCGMTMYYPADLVKDRGAVYACLLFLIQVIWTVGAGAIAFFSGHTTLKSIAAEDESEALSVARRDLGP
jgi:uncharacterized protein (TIRG00374 family)